MKCLSTILFLLIVFVLSVAVYGLLHDSSFHRLDSGVQYLLTDHGIPLPASPLTLTLGCIAVSALALVMKK